MFVFSQFVILDASNPETSHCVAFWFSCSDLKWPGWEMIYIYI